MSDHLKSLSQVYLEQISESAVPGKPAEKLKTDRAGYSIPKADQMSAAERIKKKTAEKKAALEKKHGKKMDDHPEYPNKKYVDEADMSGAPSIKDAKPAKKTDVKYDPHMKVMAPQVEKEEKEKDPFGRPGGKYGGVPKKGGGYDRAYQANMKKIKELEQKGLLRTQKEEVSGIAAAYQAVYELGENRRAARAAGGYKDDSKKQTDPSKDGFTGISGSIKDIMKQNKEIEAKNKMKKEEVEQVDENRAAMGRINKEYHRKKEAEAMAAKAKAPKDKKPAPKRLNDNPMYDPKSAGSSRVKDFKFTKEALDPVGKEDADVDNDGKKNDSNDKYIMKRRAAIRKAISKKKVSEGLSTDVENPSTDLKKLVAKAVKRIDTDVDGDVENNDKSKGKFGEFIPSADGKGRVFTKVKEELVIEVSGEDKEDKIKEKKISNKITINPELKESISEIGGEVLFISEVEEIDSIVESVHIELIEEGYSEEQVVEALKYAIDEVTNPAKVAAFKMKKAKYSPKSETKKEPKKSLKDRIKSVARKALDAAGGAVGKVMKKKAQIQAAPAKAKKKLGSYVDRAKAVAKAGYDRERGPVEKKKSTPEKKSTSYRGAGVGRKEKIGEEVATDPKMQQLQKKQIHLDRQKLSARVQAMQKKKPTPEQQQEAKNDPCWDSHKMVGMKKKGGKMVPNCVPKEEMSIADQMRISREAAAKRKPYQPGDREKQRAAQMRSAAKKAKKDTRTDAERMADATGPRPGSRYRGD